MEPDDLLASEKLERLQRRQHRSRRSSGNSPDFEDLNDEDEGKLDADADPSEPQTSESRVRPRRQAPYVIYPEVLVIVDYDGYRLHGGDNLQVRKARPTDEAVNDWVFQIGLAKTQHSPKPSLEICKSCFFGDCQIEGDVCMEDKLHILIGQHGTK